MDGWIKTYRSILTHPLWTCEPYTKGQAWIELLLLASHADNKMMINDNWVVIKRGQLHTSVLKLAARWKWSRGKVLRFLDVLKTDGMLNVECSKGGTTNGTTLTIVNYSVYQDSDTTDSTTNSTTDDTTHGTTNGQRTDINNNDKNVKNDTKNEKKVVVRFAPPTIEQVAEYCRQRKNNINAERFCAYYESIGWMVGKHKMKDWKQAVITWEQNAKKKNAQNNQPQHLFDGPGTFNVGGVEVKLGEDEYINAKGERHYWYISDGKRCNSELNHLPSVPLTAPARKFNTEGTMYLRDGNRWGAVI